MNMLWSNLHTLDSILRKFSFQASLFAYLFQFRLKQWHPLFDVACCSAERDSVYNCILTTEIDRVLQKMPSLLHLAHGICFME